MWSSLKASVRSCCGGCTGLCLLFLSGQLILMQEPGISSPFPKTNSTGAPPRQPHISLPVSGLNGPFFSCLTLPADDLVMLKWHWGYPADGYQADISHPFCQNAGMHSQPGPSPPAQAAKWGCISHSRLGELLGMLQVGVISSKCDGWPFLPHPSVVFVLHCSAGVTPGAGTGMELGSSSRAALHWGVWGVFIFFSSC